MTEPSSTDLELVEDFAIVAQDLREAVTQLRRLNAAPPPVTEEKTWKQVMVNVLGTIIASLLSAAFGAYLGLAVKMGQIDRMLDELTKTDDRHAKEVEQFEQRYAREQEDDQRTLDDLRTKQADLVAEVAGLKSTDRLHERELDSYERRLATVESRPHK